MSTTASGLETYERQTKAHHVGAPFMAPEGEHDANSRRDVEAAGGDLG